MLSELESWFTIYHAPSNNQADICKSKEKTTYQVFTDEAATVGASEDIAVSFTDPDYVIGLKVGVVGLHRIYVAIHAYRGQ